MRVLQLGPYPPPYGGVQVNLVAIRRGLRERGHECLVVNVTRHRKEERDEVYYPETPAQLLALLRRLRYDIIHLHVGGDVPLRLAALAFACATLGRGRSVLTFHSGGFPSSPEGLRARPASLRGFVFRRFDRIIAVNPRIGELFGRYGVEPARVRLICPHAATDPRPGAELPPALREFFGAHGQVLLTVGLLEEHYDLALQIDVLGRVRERFPSAGLVIIGSGSIEEELRRRIASKPYAGHVLLCGDVEHDATLRAISESDVFLRTTFYDGDSISVREALHVGVPVVATRTELRPEGVRLVPVGDGAALAEAITSELAGAASRKVDESVADKNLGDENVADENVAAVVELYEELLAGRRG